MFLTQQIKVNDDTVEILAKENGEICATIQLNVVGLFVQSAFGSRCRDW